MPSFFEKLKKGVGVENLDEYNASYPQQEDLQPTPDRAPAPEPEPIEKTPEEPLQEKPAEDPRPTPPEPKPATAKKNKKAPAAKSSTKGKKIQVTEEEAVWAEHDPAQDEQPGGFPAAEGELIVDVYQNAKEIVIQAPIAGVYAEELDVVVDNDIVTIRGTRHNPATKEDEYFTQECYWGPFSRQIILPEEVDIAAAEGTLKNGVFTLRLPKKKDQVKVKKINVKS